MNPIMPRLLKVCLLTIPVAFLFRFLFQIVVSLVAWDADALSAPYILGLFAMPTTPGQAMWLAVLWGLAFLQVSLLLVPLPATVSSPASPAQPARLGPRVLAAAFLGGLPLALLLFAALDLRALVFSDNGVPKAQTADLVGVLVVWALSWLIWTPVLLRRSRGAADALERFVGRSVKGSAVGLALCLPWYYVLRRKQSCFCGLATFWALVLGLWSLLIVGGPLLFVLARDRRIRAGVRDA